MGKRIGILTIIMVLLLSTSIVVFSETNEITNVKISLGGFPLNIPQEYGYPFLDNQSRTMIPLRIVSESLGHNVEWNQAEQKATIDGNVHITIGEKFVESGKGKIEMDTWAILKGGRTYVPLRFVVEALGYEVSYDGPKASNSYHHMVDIKGELKSGGEVDTDSGSDSDDTFVVKFPNGKEVTLVKGVDYNKRISPEKTVELVEAVFDTIEFTEDKANNKAEFKLFMPELPSGVQWGVSAQLVNRDAQYLPIYIASGEKSDKKVGVQKGVIDDFAKYAGSWKNGISDIDLVVVRVNIVTDDIHNTGLLYEAKTGRKAADTKSLQDLGNYRPYLFEDDEIDNIRPLYLPQYR